MRLKTVSTKSNNNYAIIADYKKLNGKKSTYIYENLGNDQKLKERFGTENTNLVLKIPWIKSKSISTL